ncbi:MAG TPA: PAS domain S-box protein [Polyangiales bacterium]|jgi:PAS domain S-box-containing protein|nr:PAS domain S-box protein [Polyangiales bacterium]
MTDERRILVLDAAADVQSVLSGVAQRAGCQITFRGAGEPPIAPSDAFDLVLIQLSKDRGRLAAVWRAVQGSLGTSGRPFLVIGDAQHEVDIALALDLGADDFLLLPLSEPLIDARLRVHLLARHAVARSARRARALGAMVDITQALVSTHDIQEILYTVVKRIADVVRVDRVSIVLVPHAADDLPEVASSTGFVVAASDDERVNNLRLDLTKYPEIRHVMQSKAPLTISDVGTNAVLDGVRNSLPPPPLLASLTLIPMKLEDEVMGVLFLRAQSAKGALDDQQIGFCQVLANATAIALRNARILHALRAETQRDASARVEAEQRLQALKRYADVFESAADGIAALDTEARLLYANPGAYALLGYDEGALPLGFPVYQIVADEDQRRLLALRQRFARGDFPRNVDLRIKRGDGQVITINCSFSPLHASEGAVLFSFRDVTEARKTQAELVHTRNFLQSLIDASVDAIVAADMRGTIILYNEGAQRLYGHRAEDALNKMSVKALYPGDGAREVGRMLRSKAHGGIGRLEPVRLEAIDKDGSVFPISITAATIYESGKPVATFGIFTDLRDRVRVEEQLAQAQEKLALSEKQTLVAELAGATAHELNQPLTSVMGYAELLMRKLGKDAPQYRAAEVIHSEAQRIAEIVRKIGKLTRYETKSYVGEQRILDLDRASGDAPHEGGEK